MRGSVVKRGKTYSVVVDLGRDPETGERRRAWHSGYRTKKDAEQARTLILHQIDTGTFVDPSVMTVRDYLLDEWLPARAPSPDGGARHRGRLGVQTWAEYRADLKRHVIPRLGEVKLQQLRPAQLNGLYDAMETKGGRSGTGLAPKTIKNVHGIVHKALADAVKQGLLSRNPADAVEAPRAERTISDVWTLDELRGFLAHVVGDRMYAAWLLFATTGMRRGEVAGLAWDDLDLDAGTVAVDWTLGTAGGHPAWKPRPKSKAGRRTMSLDPGTVTALRAHWAAQLSERLVAGPAWQERATDPRGQYREGVVFVWPDGSLVNPNRLTMWFRGHCRAAGLPAIRLHDVRHTYATAGLANATGWHEVKVISERLGHASVGITLDRYSHVLPARDRETADTLARLILGDAQA